ncbi:MAG TPA: class I SAM-dependent methyltransferase [Thermoanaerobaculia bacterium]|nr:class I SAM-dependent methyltransferase [Thermoanaerobaculia bacterium]
MSQPIALEAYEALAERYSRLVERKAENGYIEHPAIRKQLGEVSGKSVLDAGCGPGILADYLATHGAEVTAFDVSPKMIELARLRLGQRGRLFLADMAHPLSFLRDEEFDVVVSSLAMGYVEDWDALLKELWRVLKDHGRLVFTVQHPLNAYLGYKPATAFGVHYVQATWTGFGGNPVVVPDYYRSFADIVNPLLRAGFRLKEIVDTRPLPALREKDPSRFERYNTIPIFLCVEAWKESRDGRAPRPGARAEAEPAASRKLLPAGFAQSVHHDRSAYLNGLFPETLSRCMELDLPHQTILRLAYERLRDPELVAAYHGSPAFRLALLQELRSSAPWWEPAGRTVDDWFSNGYGFGAFSVSHVKDLGTMRLGAIDDTSLFSIGALMFYGFNLPGRPGMAFMQSPQIEVLAATFFQMIQHGRAAGMSHGPWHEPIFRELRSECAAGAAPAAVERAVREFLELHELGHTYRCNGAQPVLDLLKRRGLEDALPSLDFPSPYQLASWRRIRAGEGTIADVLFLYGDFLANMTLAASGVSPLTLTLLRAFNWWLVRPPKERSRPRGLYSFLYYTASSRLEDFCRDLDGIFETALTQPASLAGRMKALEWDHWNALRLV